jgi:hypothetical protein
MLSILEASSGRRSSAHGKKGVNAILNICISAAQDEY